MKRFLTIAATTMAVAGLSALAMAKPVSLSVDSTQSSLTVKLTGTINGQPVTGGSQTGVTSLTLFGNPPDRTFDPDGGGSLGSYTQQMGLVGDLADGAGPDPKPPGTLSIDSLGFAQLDNAVSTLKIKLLGLNFNATLSKLHATLLPGTLVPTSSMGGPNGSSTYDLVGQQLVLDGGITSVAGAEAFNFFTDPIDPIAIPAGTAVATATWDSLAPAGNRPVTLSLPLNINTTIVDVVTFEVISGVVSTLTLNLNLAFIGNIVMTGTRIPEPQTLVLLGIGLVGMVPVIRKRLRR